MLGRVPLNSRKSVGTNMNSPRLKGGESLKFVRPRGFAGSVPRNWIDRNLPLCPFCHRRSEWEQTQKGGFTPKSARYLFRCPHPDCQVILSVSYFVVSPNPGIFGLIAMGSDNYKRKLVRIESSGQNTTAASLVGKEMPLEEVARLAAARHCRRCGSALGQGDAVCGNCGTRVEL